MRYTWEKTMCTGVIIAAGIAMCAMGTSIFSLQVDVTLGLTAMAVMIRVLDDKKQSDAQIALLLTFLALIKNSALFFVAAIVIWGAYERYCSQEKHLVSRICKWTLPAVVAWCAYLIRAAIVYESNSGVQNTQLAYHASRSMEKDWEAIYHFTLQFLENVLIKGEGIAAVYIVFLLLLLTWIGLKSEKEKNCMIQIHNCAVISGIVLASYVFALYFIYLFGMRSFEAWGMFSFERYYGSIAIMLAGVAVYTCMTQSARIQSGKYYLLCILLFAALALPGTNTKKYILGAEYHDPNGQNRQLWVNMKFAVPQNNYYTDEKYVVVWNQYDFYSEEYVDYAVGAWVRSDSIYAICADRVRKGLEEEQRALIKDADYLVVLDDVSEIEQQLSELFQQTDFSIGLHELK